MQKAYSTTRMLTDQKPVLVKKPEDKFDTLFYLPELEGRMGEGGLRTQGFFKSSHNQKILITVITVVFNGDKYLEETIQSVINQHYDNIEYIIIDGGSTDGTLDIIKKYAHAIDYWVSERDKGIYHAMNKGIDLASGEWINFMNAGDRFYDSNALTTIFSHSDLENISIIYGNHEVRYPHKKRIAKVGDMKKIWQGSQFSHQSTFISAPLHKTHKFNITNRIGADFEFFYNTSKQDVNYFPVNVIVSSISSGGLSDIKRIDSIVGRWNVVEKTTKRNLYYIWLVSKEMLKERIKFYLNLNIGKHGD